MNFCTSCGAEAGNDAFCVTCGSKVEELKPEPKKSDTTGIAQAVIAAPVAAGSGISRNNKIVIGAAALVVLVFILVVGSARHWTKIDVFEHPETFHSETYSTGKYNIVDSGVSPCYVGQGWISCTNLYVSSYNATCAVYPLSATGLTYCNRYSAMIDDMQSKGNVYSRVSSLGGWGRLSVAAEKSTTQVSNNDYRPAQTHEAVCYLGFIGEC